MIINRKITGDVYRMSVYEKFSVETVDGKTVPLSTYEGKVILIVNTASKCQYTYQYEQLQDLYDKYKLNNFMVLGFPCNQFDKQEPGTSEEAAEFCQLNYGVTFPIFKKIDVNGEKESPLFKYLKQEAPFKGFDETHMPEKLLKMRLEENYPEWVVGDAIKWNFTKFLVDHEGKVIERFEPFEEPESFEAKIEQALIAAK